MNDKMLSLLGLARRAGRLTLGNDAVISAIQLGESALVLLAADLSPRTTKGVELMAQDCGIEIIRTTRTMDEISMAIGKRCGVISVNDAGFAKKVRTLTMMTNGEEM